RDVDARRDAPAGPELAEIERVDGRDLRAHAVELHAGHEAPLHGQLDELRPLEDLEHESRVVQVVRRETRGLLSIGRLDLAAGLGPGDELPLADERARRRLEPVVLEANVRAPDERQAVEHDATTEHRARLAREARVALDVDVLVVP